MVAKLVDLGADINIVDIEGWNAHEHAIFRGYTSFSELLRPTAIPVNGDGSYPSWKTSPTVEKRQRKDSATNAVRVYGHKYLNGQTMIIVTLGSNDIRTQLCTKFVNLEPSLLSTNEALSIVVSATNATGDFPVIDLPPPDSQPYGVSERPEPIVLFTTEPHKVVLKFDVVPTLGAYKRQLVARGTALLASDQISSKRPGQTRVAETSLPLRGQLTVPLIDTKSLEFVGSLGAEYLVVTPFEHPNMKISRRQTYYKSVDTKVIYRLACCSWLVYRLLTFSSKVIGHRGLGMNKRASRLQVGENTVLSFVTAASLGAEYVEFGKMIHFSTC